MPSVCGYLTQYNNIDLRTANDKNKEFDRIDSINFAIWQINDITFKYYNCRLDIQQYVWKLNNALILHSASICTKYSIWQDFQCWIIYGDALFSLCSTYNIIPNAFKNTLWVVYEYMLHYNYQSDF